MKILTSNNLVLLLSFVFLFTSVSGYYYSDDGDSYSISGDETGFSTPEFDSQREIVTELVAPFIFISVLLQFLINKALSFTFATDDNPLSDGPDVGRESMLMSLAITGMLVPSPLWDQLRLLIQSIGVVVVLGFLGLAFLVFYYMLNSGNGNEG